MKNKILIFKLILLLVLTQYTNQVFFILDPFEQRCISREMEEKATFSGVYFISGEKEENNRAFIKNSSHQELWRSDGHKNGSFNFVVERKGKKKILN
jgi:hypothetical protein